MTSGKECDYMVTFEMRGDKDIGKSQMLHKYVGGSENDFHGYGAPQFQVCKQNVSNNIVKQQIWDNHNTNMYKYGTYQQKPDGILLCFDIADFVSFKNLEQYLKDTNDAPILLVGTKSDLETKRCVVEEKAKEFISQHPNHNIIGYIETSAVNGANIDKAFQMLTEVVLKEKGVSFNTDKDRNSTAKTKSKHTDTIKKQKTLPQVKFLGATYTIPDGQKLTIDGDNHVKFNDRESNNFSNVDFKGTQYLVPPRHTMKIKSDDKVSIKSGGDKGNCIIM